jgi:hypothetical protein
VWLPLREERAVSPDEGRDLLIMGRLADGVSADEAPAEVTALPAPAEASEERSRLQLQVVPFGLRGFVPWRPVLPCCSAVLVPPSPMFAKVCRPIEAGLRNRTTLGAAFIAVRADKAVSESAWMSRQVR